MDNKKLVLKDAVGVEYVFVAEGCEQSSFSFSNPEKEISSRFSYEYKNINEEAYLFAKSVKNIELAEVSFYVNIDGEEIELFSSKSKNLKPISLRYNEATRTDIISGVLDSSVLIHNIVIKYEEE